jgi:hypothetical protein
MNVGFFARSKPAGETVCCLDHIDTIRGETSALPSSPKPNNKSLGCSANVTAANLRKTQTMAHSVYSAINQPSTFNTFQSLVLLALFLLASRPAPPPLKTHHTPAMK